MSCLEQTIWLLLINRLLKRTAYLEGLNCFADEILILACTPTV